MSRPWPSPRHLLKRKLKALRRSPFFTSVVSRLAYGALRLVYATQRSVVEPTEHRASLVETYPSIVGMWHGQHLLAPLFRPKDMAYVALLSRNVDAEINARVVEYFGIETVRGSGGRENAAPGQKGGASALLGLLRSLRAGKGVVMIADVSKGTARQAGKGIVTLAQMSGRPILPCAAATSRRHVLRKTWDRTTLPLPFGWVAVVVGDPIYVPRDIDETAFDAKRGEVTRALEAANRRALALADGRGAVSA